jgi:redox-sensitive bicupin YhaK (pirin superfamily)
MIRGLLKIVEGVETSDGAGVKLRRIIGGPELNMFDPFLLFDEFGSDNPDDYMAGFPAHPHRGFETVTYMLNGKFKHKDSSGNEGVLTDGSVQWMTAGRGVIHSEMPEKTDGLARGFQLWLNLPKNLKMIDPAYNDIHPDDIPCVLINQGAVKVISGTFNGVEGPGRPHTGMFYFDIKLNAGGFIEFPVEDFWNTFIYVYSGSANIENKKVYKGQLGIFKDNGMIKFSADDSSNLRCVVIGGKPLNEPVARGGPFVMNTKAEIMKAFSDYQKGVLTK